MSKSGGPAEPMDLQTGDRLGHFEVMRLIGEGGMGSVFLARDLGLGRKVALKLIKIPDPDHREPLEKFLFEARATAQFNHPNIVTVYEVGDHLGQPFLALEYVDGETLRQRLYAERPSIAQAVRVALAITSGVEEAHQAGIMHRDLKPENVLVGKDGRVRVLDFGIAMAIAPDTVDGKESGEAIVGTPQYMAPELWAGSATTAADIWALGVIFFELLTGRPPFDASPSRFTFLTLTEDAPLIRSIDPAIPPELERIVASCLQRDSGLRPGASELLAMLAGLVTGARTELEREANPFRGLLAFDETHTSSFFGRDNEVLAFIERLRDQPIAPVVGMSGAGKSSFVRAGVIPRLREQGAWHVVIVRPGGDAFVNLARQLVQIEGQQTNWRSMVTERRLAQQTPASLSHEGVPIAATPSGEVDEVEALAAELLASPTLLSALLRGQARDQKKRILLFVDQLEELVTLESSERRHAFMLAVCLAADDRQDPVRVIFTIRDDFLGRAADTEPVRVALAGATILRSPGPELLRETISGPLKAHGYRTDDDTLINRMVAEVDPEYGLPLLQFAARQLWERRDKANHLIRRADYEAIGGVTGALATHADGLVNTMPADDIAVARQLLLRLVTPERTRRVISERALLEGLPTSARVIVDQFLAARLLVARRGVHETELEIAHESLVRSWQQLVRWVDETKDELVFVAEAGQAAELWHKRGRSIDETWQGETLNRACTKLKLLSSQPNAIIVEFIEAGQLRQARGLRIRRLLWTILLTTLVAVTAGAIFAAFTISKKEMQAQIRLGDSLQEAALSAWERSRPVEASAKLRSAIETRDALDSRALWTRLKTSPLVASVDVSAVVLGMTYSTDGKSLLVSTNRWDQVTRVDLQTFASSRQTFPAGLMLDVAVDVPNTTVTATLGSDGPIVLWEHADDSFSKLDSKGGSSTVCIVAANSDGRLLASGDETGNIVLWNFHEKRVLKDAFSAGGRVDSMAFSADSTTLFWSQGFSLYAWTLNGETLPHMIAKLPERASQMVVNKNHLAVATKAGATLLIDTQTQQEVTWLRWHASPIEGVAFVDDGATFVSKGNDGYLVFFSTRTWLAQKVLTVEQQGGRLAVARDGMSFAMGGADGVVRIFRASAASLPSRSLAADANPSSLALSDDGRFAALGSSDKTVHLKDTRTGETRYLTGHSKTVSSVAFSPDGQALVSGSNDLTIRAWSVKTSLQLVEPLRLKSRPNNLNFSPDGEVFAISQNDGRALILSWPNMRVIQDLLVSEAGVFDVAFDGRKALVATASVDGLATLWDRKTGAKRRTFDAKKALYRVALSPDGSLLATADVNGEVRLWSVADGTHLLVPANHMHYMDGAQLRFVDHGRKLAISGQDNDEAEVVFFDVQTKQLERVPGPVGVYDITPDGRFGVTVFYSGNDLNVFDLIERQWKFRASIVKAEGGAWLFDDHGWQARHGVAHPSLQDQLLVRLQEQDLQHWDPASGNRCIKQANGELELWSRGGVRAMNKHFGRGTTLRTLQDVCWVVAVGTPGKMELDRCSEGECETLSREASLFLEVIGSEVFITEGSSLVVFAADGHELRRHKVAAGVSAMAKTKAGVFLGTYDGALFSFDDKSGTTSPVKVEALPPYAFTSLAEGPGGTLIAGFSNGAVVIWSATGKRLDTFKLVGEVKDVAVDGDELLATSQTGDSLRLSLANYGKDYCVLLREIWGQVPNRWQDNLQVAPVPSDHRCSTENVSTRP